MRLSIKNDKTSTKNDKTMLLNVITKRDKAIH